MTLEAIMEFILLPCVGWLMLTTSKQSAKLARSETLLDLILPDHQKNHPKKKHED